MARFGIDDAAPTVKRVTEAERTLPVTAEADVIVAGGGIAGVAAAIAAARNGASVCLLEKSYGLGGLATLGNVTVYLPICDGMGRQVMGGLAEELLHLSVAGLKRDNSPA
ncbi:MAG: FAD-dependent oxidoreductase, partial [Gemmatimonadetes bacterium]|nr:FAD-dependent oxidoreductase [Gemmatimonadota bacterium]